MEVRAQATEFGVQSQIRVHSDAKGLDTTAWYEVRQTATPSGCRQLALVGIRRLGGRWVVDSGAAPTHWGRIDYATVLRAQTRAADSLPWQEVERYWMQIQAPSEGCSQGSGWYFGAGLGAGGARSRYSGYAEHGSGMIAHGRLGWGAVLLDVEWHPYELPYPAGFLGYPTDFGFTALDVIPSVQISLGQVVYVEGGVGWQYRYWKSGGSEVTDHAWVGGASVGHTWRIARALTFAPELVGRYALVSDGPPPLSEASFVGVRAVLTYSASPP